MTIAILGRQPGIGLAELESMVGAPRVRALGAQAAAIEGAVPEHKRLGGTIKLAKPLAEIPATDWQKIFTHCLAHLPNQLAQLPQGKLKIGLSVYGLPVSVQQLFRSGLELKKACRAAGQSVRVVPNTSPALNSAQVAHNQLTGELGWELLFIKDGHRTWLAQTISVQNVDDYARRDHGRPVRDAFVGMLPPKLAQIMLNLAGVQAGAHVLDPFCGTGVVLQEATLMGCSVYGTDVSERMVRATRDNIAWLEQMYGMHSEKFFEVADATDATWRGPLEHVVCETYLGQPLSGLPKPEKLDEIIQTCDTITTKFLKNLQPQLAKGSRHCLAVPAWRVKNTFLHLGVLDHLEDLGYNRLQFQYAANNHLTYHREGQIVARELLVVTVK